MALTVEQADAEYERLDKLSAVARDRYLTGKTKTMKGWTAASNKAQRAFSVWLRLTGA